MKVNWTIFCVLFFMTIGCQTSSEPIKEDATKKELNELSVYHLPTAWNTQNNETISFVDLEGNVLVVVMIYTSCKAACPRLVADMKSIATQVSAEANGKVKYVLISIDPEKDTPKRLKDFAVANEMTEDHWIFLQGTENTVREFANVVAMKYREISPIDFSHSNIISVFDPEGVMVHQQEGLGVDNDETVSAIVKLAKMQH